jgi:hypothetical protein
MHTNDVSIDYRLCSSDEIEMVFHFQVSNPSGARRRTEGVAATMLSDAHHLGALMDSGACRGTPYAVTVHAENLLFLTIF